MTTMRTILSRAALGLLLVSGGCGGLLAANATPAPAPMEGKLAVTLQSAEREAAAARFGIADRLLSDFAEAYPNTPEAVETGYWRALFKLDPNNQTATTREALVLLDGYLNAYASVAHRGSATALRRAAQALNRPATVVAVPTPVTSPAPGAASRPDVRPDARPDDKASEEEIKRLKEELAKANAELERIKKRLSQPNP